MLWDTYWVSTIFLSTAHRTSADGRMLPSCSSEPLLFAHGMSIKISCAGLTTDARRTADPGVASSIPARSHTLVES